MHRDRRSRWADVCLCVAMVAARGVHPLSVGAADNWAYVLQVDSGDFAALSASAFQLLVIDYADDDGNPFAPAHIAQLQGGPCGPRPVVAYMSVGEAETYRFYWDAAWETDPPGWLGPENPDWPENYKVRYWDPEWQQYIVPPGLPAGQSYLERILARGFDGAYLDIIDAYEYWGPDGVNENPDAATDMVAFVAKIAAFARSHDPGFLVFPQNGSGLVEEDGYLALVSGIGAEDTWYDGDVPQDPEHTNWVLPHLRAFRDAGGTVLVVDYVTQQPLIDSFYALAQAEGFVPYATVRDLDVVTINPGHQPVCPQETATPTSTPWPPTATPSGEPVPALGWRAAIVGVPLALAVVGVLGWLVACLHKWTIAGGPG